MAGRYLILEFDDRHEAEAMIEGIRKGHIDGHRLHRLNNKGLRVVALYLKPTRFCQCPERKRQDGRNWFKGKRSGLYLCYTCRKPSIFHQRGVLQRLQYVFGFNQLEKGES